ncbi:Dirigent protein 23 [Bienertia sinuspersici]
MVFAITLLTTLCTSFATCANESHAQQSWAKTVGQGRIRQKTTLEFYYHDVISGESPTAVLIARAANGSNDDAPLAFGKLFMFDDPLTMGPDPDSKLVGRAQGMYGSDSLGEVGLIMAMAFTFNEGIYNGSSISILVHNPITVKHRELPIVGGTGLFRMAQGYAVPNTYMLDLKTGDAIVGYNVTILHYKKDYYI